MYNNWNIFAEVFITFFFGFISLMVLRLAIFSLSILIFSSMLSFFLFSMLLIWTPHCKFSLSLYYELYFPIHPLYATVLVLCPSIFYSITLFFSSLCSSFSYYNSHWFLSLFMVCVILSVGRNLISILVIMIWCLLISE